MILSMMNRGRFLVSINTFPIYSPINPILNNCIPPNRYIGNTDDGQPGTALESNAEVLKGGDQLKSPS